MLSEALDGFYGGLLHPLLVPSHALALVGLGLLIGQQVANKRVAPLILFVLGLAAGLGAIAGAVGETPAGNVLLASVAVSGALVALAAPLRTLLTGALAAVMGAAIGLDSPPEVVSLREAVLMLIGTGIGASIGLAIVVACASRLGRGWQAIGVRVLGSWTAASAMLALALRLAR
jgi:urease accessory protein